MGLGSSPPRSSANPSGRSSAPLPIALSPLPAALCSPPTARPPRASGYRRGSDPLRSAEAGHRREPSGAASSRGSAPDFSVAVAAQDDSGL